MIRTRRFAFQRHGPKRLDVRISVNPWAGTWDEVVVRMDAVEVGRTNYQALREGVDLKLFDHSVLRMWLEFAPSGPPTLNITRNGHPLPGSGGDPQLTLHAMVTVLWIFSGLHILIESVFMIPADLHEHLSVRRNCLSATVSAIVILLGIAAWRRSVPALVAMCALFFGHVIVWLGLHFHPIIALQLLTPMIMGGWLALRAIRSAIELKTLRLPIRHPSEHAA